ncbi:MAG: hypothetical protein M1817_005354 [Caeruleum heppii]|nr:MAG: hypothetical protein M1817_005354 [Caeruleum heppii]
MAETLCFSATVLECHLPTEFLDYILKHYATPTTVVVCSTREAFLEQLHLALRREVSDVVEPGTSPISHGVEQSKEHPLLRSTIHQIGLTRGIRLAFCPSLQHLRAYLSVYQSSESHEKDSPLQGGPKTSILGLLNPISIHRHTPELSAQGISRTLATAVDAAVRAGMQIVMAEYEELSEEGEATDYLGNTWDEEVPLLNGTVRGYGTDERAWMGRTVSLRRIAMRWCSFEHYEDRQDVDDT